MMVLVREKLHACYVQLEQSMKKKTVHRLVGALLIAGLAGGLLAGSV